MHFPEPVNSKDLTVARVVILNSRMMRRFALTAGGLPFRMGPEWQRARAIIRWYGPADTPGDRYRQAWVIGRWPIRRRIPVNRLLLRYWEQVRHAKTLKLRGFSGKGYC